MSPVPSERTVQGTLRMAPGRRAVDWVATAMLVMESTGGDWLAGRLASFGAHLPSTLWDFPGVEEGFPPFLLWDQ